jgi:hypothetical protein
MERYQLVSVMYAMNWTILMIVFTVIDHAACKDNSTNSRNTPFWVKNLSVHAVSWSLRPVYAHKNKNKNLLTRTC